MNSKLRAVLIGNSKYAFNVHIPYLRNSNDVDLLAIATSRVGNENSIPILGHEKAYNNYKKMLDEIQPDLVVISSAPGAHYEQIIDSLHHKAHVLVDKAMVCSKKQAMEVIDLAESEKRLLGVAVQRRYDNSTTYMSSVVRSKGIGDITFVTGFYCRWFPPFDHTWRNHRQAAWGGITADSGYHLIDTLLWILNSNPVSVHSELMSVNLDVEDISSLNVRLENNIILNLLASYVPPKNYIREEFSIFGKKGALIFSRNEDATNVLHSRLIHLNDEGQEQSVPSVEAKSDNESPVRNFVNSVLGREELLATGKNSLRTICLIEAAYQSAHNGRVELISL